MSRSKEHDSDENVPSKGHGSDAGDENVTLPFVEPTARTSSTTDLNTDPGVKSALQEITSLLNTVVKRVERVETELKKQSSVSSSSDSNTPAKKVHIPLIIRVS